jgi:hypothetical protein
MGKLRLEPILDDRQAKRSFSCRLHQIGTSRPASLYGNKDGPSLPTAEKIIPGGAGAVHPR